MIKKKSFWENARIMELSWVPIKGFEVLFLRLGHVIYDQHLMFILSTSVLNKNAFIGTLMFFSTCQSCHISPPWPGRWNGGNKDYIHIFILNFWNRHWSNIYLYSLQCPHGFYSLKPWTQLWRSHVQMKVSFVTPHYFSYLALVTKKKQNI